MSTNTAEQRTLAAEVRAVEEGHRAFVQDDGTVRVVSDRHDGRFYTVAFHGWRGDAIRFTCTPEGHGACTDDHGVLASRAGGETRCKHAALAARRLEREGLAVWRDGLWFASDLAPEFPVDDDPFAGMQF